MSANDWKDDVAAASASNSNSNNSHRQQITFNLEILFSIKIVPDMNTNSLMV